MANKEVKYTEVYEKDLFNNFIKSAEEALKTLDKLNEGLKQTLKETGEIAKQKPFGNDIEGLRRREKAIEDNRKAVEGLDKVEKERLRLEERLKNAVDERAKANASLRLQIQEANRQAKENAKIEGDLGPYKQKSAELTKLKKQYKDLAIEEGTSTKEARKLLKQIQELDNTLKELDESVGEGGRSVGLYRRALEGVERQAARLERQLNDLRTVGVVQVFTQLFQIFQQTEQGGANLNKAIAEITTRLTLYVNAVSQAFKETKNLFSGVSEITDAFTKFQKSDKGISDISTFFTELKEAFSADNGFSEFGKNLEKNFEGIEEQAKKAVESRKSVIDGEIASQREIARLTTALAAAEKAQAEFAVASTDSTLSLKEQDAAAIEFRRTRKNALNLEIAIANEEVKLARLREKASKDRRKDDQADAALALQTSQAIQARAQAEAELTNFLNENAAVQRQNASDLAEIELDALLDSGDRLKTIREQIANDESKSFDERVRALLDAERDIKNSFERQVQVVETLLGTTINANDLIATSDTVALSKKVRDITASEAIQKRIIEIINERRAAEQDLADATTDLNRKEQESNAISADTALVTRALFDLQEEGIALSELLAKLEEDRLNTEIEALRTRLLNLDAESEEAIAIRAELYEKQLDQQSKFLEKQKEKEDKARDERLKAEKQAQQAIFQLIDSLTQKRLDAQQKAIDKELEGVRQRQDALRRISEEGQVDASKALAFEQRKEAELERKREQQARRRARLELALSAVETYSNKVTAGEANPLQSTITDISLLQAFVASLPTFYQGAENVGEALGVPHLNTPKDQYMIRVDKNERILNPYQNAMLPRGLSNNMLVSHVLNSMSGNNTINKGIDKRDLQEVMYNAIERIPRNNLAYDPVERAIIEVVERKGKIERKRKKTGGIW